jgi:hypothetical protein
LDWTAPSTEGTRCDGRSPLLRAGRVDGTIALSSALRYDAAARALRLEQSAGLRPTISTLRIAYGIERAEAAAVT